MNRRDFLLSGCAHLFVCATLPPLLVSETRADIHRGGRVGWARLGTPDDVWRRHAESDSIFSDFIRTQTTLNIDPEWASADVGNLATMCDFPMLFTNSIHRIARPDHRANLAEYLRRGGFLLVDSCINRDLTPDPDAFYQNQTAAFLAILPGCEIRRLPEEHDIYRNFFEMSERPPHAYHGGHPIPAWKKHGLYAIHLGDSPVALLSLSGMQCAWTFISQDSRSGQQALRMMANIYVYAMTR
jgi:hypothetical protein